MEVAKEVIEELTPIEKRRIVQKKYFEKHREYIYERIRKYINSFGSIECACGSKHSAHKTTIKNHYNTIKHQKYLKYVKKQAELGLSAENYPKSCRKTYTLN